MEVFHYCTEVLKETPLFESCRDEDINIANRNEGALYNNVDKDPSIYLMPESDFEKSEDDGSMSQTSDVEELSIGDKEIDSVMMKVDEMNEERWIKDHPLFSNADDESYTVKVKSLLAMSEKDWKALPIYAEDRERYIILNSF